MLEPTYLQSVVQRFGEQKALGEKTFAQLRDEELLLQPNAASNSIAQIVQHLHGNMVSRWTHFLTEDGEKPYRNRDAEFEVRPLARESILQLWHDGWKVLLDTLTSLQPDDLQKTVTIRTQPLTVVDAINRQLAHYAYHVGQIVYLGRWIRNEAWQSLSIPKGGSQAFNQQLQEKP